MAKIARRLAEGRWHVTIKGHLGAADLFRLERTCAPALERSPMPLDLEVANLSGADEAALLFLRRLQERGAVLVGRVGGASGDVPHATQNRDRD